MTTLRQAAQDALDAMNFESPAGEGQTAAMDRFIDEHDAAVAGLTAALAAPEQQPVAWFEHNASLDAWFLSYGFNPKAKTRPLYTAPPNIEALTKERDAALEQNTLLDAACAKLEAERDALMQAAKLALDVLERASDAGYGIESDDAIEALKKAGV